MRGPSGKNFFSKWCPICGQWLNGQSFANHQCPKKVLDGIDGAHSVSGEEPHPFTTCLRSEADRLHEGLKIMKKYDFPPDQEEGSSVQ